MVRFAGVVVETPERRLLEIGEFAVARGEIVGVVGPNGAGKSTLLRLAALLQRPNAGRIWIGGVEATEREIARLRPRVGMVFQSPLLFDVTVLTNATAGLRFHGVAKRDADERAMEWLRRFGVEALAGRGARGLSGGEAQRVCLARAFAPGPELLCLDEPFTALDAPARTELVPELARHLRATGTSALIVTHEPCEIAAFVDRLTILIGGRIVQQGSPIEIEHAPVSSEVARLFGATADVRLS